MSENKHTELSKEYFDSIGTITNNEIDFSSGDEYILVIDVDTPFEFDKDLVQIYNERNEDGNKVNLPDREHADVWVNTTFNISPNGNDGYDIAIEIRSAGEFAAKEEQYQDEVDEFDIDDCINLTEKETQMFIAVLEESFGKSIDEIFNDNVTHQEINPQEMFRNLNAGEKVRLQGDYDITYKFTRDPETDTVNLLAISNVLNNPIAYQEFAPNERIDVNAVLRGNLPMWDIKNNSEVTISKIYNETEKGKSKKIIDEPVK